MSNKLSTLATTKSTTTTTTTTTERPNPVGRRSSSVIFPADGMLHHFNDSLGNGKEPEPTGFLLRKHALASATFF